MCVFAVLAAHITEVEGDFQVVPEVVGELGIHVQHLQNVFSEDFMEIAVGQSPHISVGLTRPGVKVDGLAKDVVLPWKRSNEMEMLYFFLNGV